MDRIECGLRELKFAAGDAMSFSGYGAVFGNVDSYGDMIAPGAFADTLAEAQKSGQWPAMLLQHGGWGMGSQDMTPIGVWTSLSEDGHGLKVEGTLAPTPRGQEVYALMKMQPRPAIDGLSIGYSAIKFTNRSKPEEPRRTLEKVKLFEISPVTFPANDKARVTSVKSESIELITSWREAEDYLRDAGGFSRREAKAFIARLSGLGQRDADEGEEVKQLVAALARKRNLMAA